MKVLRHDARVPRSTGRGDQARDQVRENARQYDNAPAIRPAEVEQAGDLPEIGWNGAGSRDDVEQYVPLRADQHEDYRAHPQSAAELDDPEQQDREERGGRDRGRDLRDRLHDPGEPRIE